MAGVRPSGLACALALLSGPSCLWAAGGVCQPAGFVVALDPGHTALQPGAISARGVPELVFNHRLARDVRRALVRAGFRQTFLTTSPREQVDLPTRTQRAAARGARLLVSLHHDSVQPQYLARWRHQGREFAYSDRFSGHSLFVSQRQADAEASLTLARHLGQALLERCLIPTRHHAEPIAGENRSWLDETRGIHRFDDLVVLRTAAMPAVLFEAGIIVNRRDERVLSSAAHRRVLGDAVVQAVRRFCEAAPVGPTPTPSGVSGPGSACTLSPGQAEPPTACDHASRAGRCRRADTPRR